MTDYYPQIALVDVQQVAWELETSRVLSRPPIEGEA